MLTWLQKNRIRNSSVNTHFANLTRPNKMSACAPSSLGFWLVFGLASIAKSAPLSEVELKNLLAAIRQNRTTQADFQERRVIRLMKNPVLSFGYSLVPAAEQVPARSKRQFAQHHREQWSRAMDLLSELQVGRALPIRQRIAAGCHGGGDQFRAESGKHRNQLQHLRHQEREWTRAATAPSHRGDETSVSKA